MNHTVLKFIRRCNLALQMTEQHCVSLLESVDVLCEGVSGLLRGLQEHRVQRVLPDPGRDVERPGVAAVL